MVRRSLTGGSTCLFLLWVMGSMQSTPGIGQGTEGLPPGAMVTNAAFLQAASFVGAGDPRPAIWTVIPSPNGNGSLSFTVEFKGFSASAVPGGYVLHVPGEATSAAPGTPAIPRIAKLFPGIKDRTARIQVTGLSPTEVTNVSVAAAVDYEVVAPKGEMRKLRPVRRQAQEIYARDEFWPPELGQVEEAWIGTQKVVRVEVFPLQYHAKRKTIRFYGQLEGIVTFDR